MNNIRMPKILLNYRPNGQRRLGRPLKRILDEAETAKLVIDDDDDDDGGGGQPPTHRIVGAVPQVKRPEREAGH
jgi:hypothetical protein